MSSPRHLHWHSTAWYLLFFLRFFFFFSLFTTLIPIRPITIIIFPISLSLLSLSFFYSCCIPYKSVKDFAVSFIYITLPYKHLKSLFPPHTFSPILLSFPSFARRTCAQTQVPCQLPLSQKKKGSTSCKTTLFPIWRAILNIYLFFISLISLSYLFFL